MVGILNGVTRRVPKWDTKLHINNALLGWSQFRYGKHWIGMIDSINIYSQALHVYQIKELYAATAMETSPITAGGGTPYWRPQLHFTARKNWINDPNGLIYDDLTKIYHGFYNMAL